MTKRKLKPKDIKFMYTFQGGEWHILVPGTGMIKKLIKAKIINDGAIH